MERLLNDNETWLTSEALAELFEVEVELIESYINTVFEAGELDEATTIRKYKIVGDEHEDGDEDEDEDEVELYSFEVILALGYRIESRVGTLFRKWAGRILTAYSQKGYAIDIDRLRNSNSSFDDFMESVLSL